METISIETVPRHLLEEVVARLEMEIHPRVEGAERVIVAERRARALFESAPARSGRNCLSCQHPIDCLIAPGTADGDYCSVYCCHCCLSCGNLVDFADLVVDVRALSGGILRCSGCYRAVVIRTE